MLFWMLACAIPGPEPSGLRWVDANGTEAGYGMQPVRWDGGVAWRLDMETGDPIADPLDVRVLYPGRDCNGAEWVHAPELPPGLALYFGDGDWRVRDDNSSTGRRLTGSEGRSCFLSYTVPAFDDGCIEVPQCFYVFGQGIAVPIEDFNRIERPFLGLEGPLRLVESSR